MTEKELQRLALTCVQETFEAALNDFEQQELHTPKDTRYLSLSEQVKLDYRLAKVADLADTLHYLKERFGLDED